MSAFRIYSFLLCILAFQFLIAQPPLRKEIEIEDLQTQHLILPMGQQGVFVAFASTDNGKSEETTWNFKFYNTWFSPVSADSLMLPLPYNLHTAHADSQNVLMLFTASGTIQEKEIFYLVRYNIPSQRVFMSPLSLNYAWSPDWIWIDDNQIFIAGKHSVPAIAGLTQFIFNLTSIPFFTGASVFKLKPLLVGFNYERPVLETIQSASFRKNTWLGQPIKSLAEEKYLFPLLGIHKNRAYLDVIEHRPMHSTFTIASLAAPQAMQFSQAQLTYGIDNALWATGTWMCRKGSAANPSLQGFELSSKGLFYCKITPENQADFQLVPFALLNHYFYFFEKPKLKRASQKTEKLRKHNKLPNYHFDVILAKTFVDKNGKLVFHGESVYPNYIHTSRNSDSEKLTSITHGFRHNHSFTTIINPTDNLVWDMGLNTNGVVTLSKDICSASLITTDDGILMFNENGHVKARFQPLFNGQSAYQHELVLPSLYAHDKATHESNQGVFHWHKNVFIAYGIQVIFNSQLKEKRRRTVIYMSKFAVE